MKNQPDEMRPLGFKDHLKLFREAKGWTQADMAKQSGFLPAAISHFETGERTPSLHNLIKLCNALGVTLDELVVTGPKAEPPAKDSQQVAVSERHRVTIQEIDNVPLQFDSFEQRDNRRAQILAKHFPDQSAEIERLRAEVDNRWCPDCCPVTRLPFFMWIGDEAENMVPTYGGPYDSYTIPVMDDEIHLPWHEREMCRERYDHDQGSWIDGCEIVSVRIICDEKLMDLEDKATEVDQLRERVKALEDVLRSTLKWGFNGAESYSATEACKNGERAKELLKGPQ